MRLQRSDVPVVLKMFILSVAIIVFVILESFNIGMLYFRPGTRLGNGLGVFNAFSRIEGDPERGPFVRYLVDWVAGTKLIFVALLLVILVTGSDVTKAAAVAVLIPTVLVFYWRMYPAIVRLDAAGEITPPGYSRTLGIMIGAFVGGFAVALAIAAIVGLPA